MYSPTRSALSQSELSVLRLTNHYGMSVVEVVARLPELNGYSSKAVQRLLGRLVRRRLLTEAWLYAGRRCYLLAAAGFHAITDAETFRPFDNRPLSEESKIRRFAMLSFCCLGRTVRMRISPSVRQDASTDLGSALLTGSYYMQLGNSTVYGFLRVDMCGEGRWDRVIAKCADDARRMKTSDAWKTHIAAGHFEITIATALPQKAERLSRELGNNPAELPVRIAVIPDLLQLIAPIPI